MIPFASFAPDMPTTDGATVAFVDNVRPRTQQSWGPLKALSTTGTALTARCQGARSFRGTNGNIETFAGDATKLYRWNGSTWVDVSKVGGYSTPPEGRWTFEQFDNFIYAANGADTIQTWTIGTSSVFADAAGAPTGRYLAAVRRFLFVGHLSSDSQAVQTSAIDDSTSWTGTQSDTYNFSTNGRITGVVGGQYALIFQERAIHLGTYVNDPDVFQFDQVSQQIGSNVPGSIATQGQTTIFVGKDGFYRIDGGQVVTPIGDGWVDEYFWDNVNRDYLYRVWSCFDVRKKEYYITFPTTLSSDGTPDRTLIFSLTNTAKPWGQQSAIGYDVLFQMFSGLSIDLDTDSGETGDSDLDAGLPSFDSEIYFGSSVPKLAAFNSAKLVGFFTGANLEAVIDTVEARLAAGWRAFVSCVRPVIDGGTISVALGTRNRPNDSITVSSFVTQNNSGECRFRSSAKQHKARVKVAAGSTWSHAQGVEFDSAREGDR